MHELGIVFHIAKKVEAIAVENHVSHVEKVVLEIGEVSTVIPSYLEDCWNWKCSKSEVLDGCQLEVEMIPAVTFCEDCEKTYGTVEHGKICPYCGSENTYLVQGNEHAIKEIVVLDDAQEAEDTEADEAAIEQIEQEDNGAMEMLEETESRIRMPWHRGRKHNEGAFADGRCPLNDARIRRLRYPLDYNLS